jgi:DNA topoisomerase I
MTETQAPVVAYCMKCKTKRDMLNAEPVYFANGTPATAGVCSVCGTRMTRSGRTPAHDGLPKPEVTARPKKQNTAKGTKAPKASKRPAGKGGKLVIVESPAKARSVGGFLGKGYTVTASRGHVRDLLVSQLSVDVDNHFAPKYRVPNDKRDIVKSIKQAVGNASEIFLATDPDREGEAIAWHLIEATDMPLDRTKRVVFHEITDEAVAEAFEHPRSVNEDLVNAQQARRILDRLVGYNITELLWDRVRNRLTAGRVQSVALRLVVDREREIEAFTAEEYWSIEALLSALTDGSEPFTTELARIDGENIQLTTQAEVEGHVARLRDSHFRVDSVKKGERRRKPAAPFTTSTLQQEASKALGYRTSRTMRIAQQLYEGIQIEDGHSVGLITYMRTDSVAVAKEAQQAAAAYIQEKFGEQYAPKKPPQYKTKAKSAQEAHEAVRPTDITRSPLKLRPFLKPEQFRLYQLIWERFVASQMADALYDTQSVTILSGLAERPDQYTFRASGSLIRFRGFLALYEEAPDEDIRARSKAHTDKLIPNLQAGQDLRLLELSPDQHFTTPPPRYTEASLVAALEQYGIGRPSTYAATVGVIQERGYVQADGKRLVPTEVGATVNDLLVEYFPEEVDYQFTAKMESLLDDVAEGKRAWQPVLEDFYRPFAMRLHNAWEHMPAQRQEEYVGRSCPSCGTGELIVKFGRYGKFIGCTHYPECRYTEQFIEYIGVPCPQCGAEHDGQMVLKKTRRGRVFYGCSRYPDCDYSTWQMPKTSDAQEPAKEEEQSRNAQPRKDDPISA